MLAGETQESLEFCFGHLSYLTRIDAEIIYNLADIGDIACDGGLAQVLHEVALNEFGAAVKLTSKFYVKLAECLFTGCIRGIAGGALGIMLVSCIRAERLCL